MKQFAVAVAIIGGILFAGFHPAEAHAATTDKWSPCITEDQTAPRCVWDASARGNGEGRSFFVNAKGRHFISDARAKSMLAR